MAVQFPKDFMWGTATASYQIEGAFDEDGRLPSIWDTFSRTPGCVTNGDTGDVACDHYHRYREDAALIADLGVQAYRFSIAWPRVIPQGTGEVNQAGLDFYSRLVDELLERGVTPHLTLYHWDLPQALQDRGGWANRDSVAAFVNFADVVSRKLSDRVPFWTTINEPWCVAFLGNLLGDHAPGLRDLQTAVDVSHHVMLAHGEAVSVLRGNGASQVGIVLNPTHVEPYTDTPADRAAAWRQDGFINRWWLDPLFKGSYPLDMLEWMGEPPIQSGDMDKICTPLDFLGVNYYQRSVTAAGEDSLLKAREVKPEGEYTAQNWEVYPPGLYYMLKRIWRDYNPPPLYVTENGAAYDDELVDGHVHDERRRAYLQAHFEQALKAREEGVDLRGYFVWSLMDNFEWAYGYDKRFGIVHVDYATQQRTLKDSALWYKGVIRNNGWE
ncbi:MAG: GH1 family beta-glucosidase [Chloroflexota bacterium]